MISLVRPSPCVLILRCSTEDLGVFHGRASSTIARVAPTSTLGCTSETATESLELLAKSPVRLPDGGLPMMRLARPGPCVGVAVPRLLRSCVPLAASLLEFGLPEVSTPGIFRPWPFSGLRRFTPPDSSPVLFHTGTTSGIQRTFAMFCLLCNPSGAIQRRSFWEHKNRAW
jgi:hypothetical protein